MGIVDPTKEVPVARLRDARALYLRENNIERPLFHGPPFTQIRILDLALNRISGDVSWLSSFPRLAHLTLTGNNITSLVGLSDLPDLAAVSLSANAITSLHGMRNLPSLRMISISNNPLKSFAGIPHLPSLAVLQCDPSPLASHPHYRVLAVAVAPTLDKIDTHAVTVSERSAAQPLRGKLAVCIADGLLPDARGPLQPAALNASADAFCCDTQRDAGTSHPIHLLEVGLVAATSTAISSPTLPSVPLEGGVVRFRVALLDVRPFRERRAAPFRSRELLPLSFRVSGEASCVQVVGSMNAWREPIELQEVHDPVSAESYWQATAYVPSGEYEYRYVVDGVEKVGAHMKAASQFGMGLVNMHRVPPMAPDADYIDGVGGCVLHVRWLRAGADMMFDTIAGANGLSYVPTAADVGCCLRAEVLAYVGGVFSCLYYAVSAPVARGPPKISDLQLRGTGIEGEALHAQWEYRGGKQGRTTLRWSRVASDGIEEVPPPAGTMGVVARCPCHCHGVCAGNPRSCWTNICPIATRRRLSHQSGSCPTT